MSANIWRLISVVFAAATGTAALKARPDESTANLETGTPNVEYAAGEAKVAPMVIGSACDKAPPPADATPKPVGDISLAAVPVFGV